VADRVVTRLVHHVRAQHASTGRPLQPVTAQLEDPPPGWHVSVKGADVVVTTRDGMPAPAQPPVLTLALADPRQTIVMQAPQAQLTLNAPAIVHEFTAAAMTLTVELVTAAGEASTGQDVKARGTAGSPVPLPEVSGEPGLYRSAPRVWGKAFDPFTLAVGTEDATQLSIDFSRTDTRVRVLDPN
jgi:hypothetical protein